ncbi:hypothetical protein SUGI_0723770 [Cryptomeria japonica]|uniref:glucan endo-1,3-beta-glucosidase-like n=1 Tax=Cryptomeria japonica TaxID=3369 RepID=UPI002414C448|nr:glucan endo-1,3-beta-glucosidase-like [Cryptomeria japonica]GLJ36070.1 hypothetical protein SUGI_0723770 [Cryptomeria japonica]
MASLQGNKDCYALVLLIIVSFYTTHADGEKIGVCYGMLSDSLPSHNEVVTLLKSNIGKVRLYEANRDAMQALKSSGIEVIVGIGNNELEKIAGDQGAANGWVNDNIKAFYPSVDIKYIAVGNEVFANRAYVSYLLPAMNNIQTALSNANLQNDIKVSTPHATSVLNNSYPPSQGTFGEDISSILKFLSDNDSPFMANVYPYFSYKDNTDSISADYALFRSMSTVVNDGSLMYNNLFDAMVDTFISAMEKLGHSNIPIVITETGWPSAGNVVATVDNARTYNNNLIKHVLSNAGTPKRPGTTIDTYIFALFNENQKGGDEEERHFGLFETNKTPAYTVFSSPESSRSLKVVYIYLTVV